MTLLERFLETFRQTGGVHSSMPVPVPNISGGAEIASLAGTTFENGLYRLATADGAEQLKSRGAEAFPEFADRIIWSFGYDWLGRQFVLDRGRTKGGGPMVLMLEPGTGEGIEIPATLETFHNEELVDYRDAALAADFFGAWTREHPEPVALSACVGYRRPLFLGGKDETENLEMIDLDVYWSICGQLRAGIKDLPPGTTVRSVSIS